MQNAPLKATAHRPKRGQRGLPLFLFLFFQSATFSSAPLRTVQERDESAPYDAMTAGDENDVTSGIEPACFFACPFAFSWFRLVPPTTVAPPQTRWWHGDACIGSTFAGPTRLLSVPRGNVVAAAAAAATSSATDE